MSTLIHSKGMLKILWYSLAAACLLILPWSIPCWGAGAVYLRVINGTWPHFDEVFWLPFQLPVCALLKLAELTGWSGR